MLAQQLITETEEAEQVSHAPVIAALFSRLSDKQLAPAALAALLRYRDELAARDFMDGNFDFYLRCVPDKQRRHFEQMCKKEKRGKHKSSHAASPETALPSKTIKKLPDQATTTTTTTTEVSRPDVDHSRSVPRLSSFPIAAGRSSRAEGGGGGGTKTRTPSLPPIGSTREAQGDRRARSLVMADTGRGDQQSDHHSDQHRHRDHHRDHHDHHHHHHHEHHHHEPHQSWSVIPDIVRHSAGSGPAGHAAARTRATRDRDTRALEDLLSPSPHPDSDLPEPNRR